MTNDFEGVTHYSGGRFGVIVSRYNESVTKRLLEGAVDALTKSNVPGDAIDVAWTPGAFEIPVIAQRMACSKRYVAVICLGAVIRGETTHDQHINRAVSAGICEVSLRSGIPVLFGILTCDTLEQAIHRSGGNVGNKGTEAAIAALEMVSLMQNLPA